MIDEQLEHDHEYLAVLQQAGGRPDLLDTGTIDRVVAVYRKSAEIPECFARQLTLWRKGQPTQSQQQEISRLERQVEQIEYCQRRILALANEIKGKIIELIIGKRDVDLELDFLSQQI